MAKRLTRTVFVDGVAYGPESSIPKAVAQRITNPNVWDDVVDPEPKGVVDDEDAAAAGAERFTVPAGDVPVPDAEATVKELREYAKAKGVTLGAAKTKPEILAVLGLDIDAESEEPESDTDTESSDSDES